MTNEGRQYTFRLPKGYNWIFSAGLGFFLALTAYALYLPVVDRQENTWGGTLLALLILLPLSGLVAWALRHVHDYVVADDSGLTHVVHGQKIRLKWLDIRTVNHRTTTLKVTDARGRSVTLDYALDGFQHLRDLIVNRAENHELDSSVPREFHQDLGVRTSFTIALVVALTFAIFWMWLEGSTAGDLLIPGAFLVLMVCTLLPGVKRVTVTPEILILNYWLKRTEIPYPEISWIALGERAGDGVMLRYKHGQTIRLGHFREGTVEFYRLLRLVLEKAQEQ